MTRTLRDDRVLPLTRAGIWILLILAAANGIFLYLVPGRAATDYAWSIKPPVNAAFIGAGFLAGTLATGLVLAKARRWRTFSSLPVALWVLAFLLAVATAVHADKFRWDYPPTWVWALVYGAVPLAVPYLVAQQRRVADAPPDFDPALRWVRVLSAVIGVPLLVGSLALFIAPGSLGVGHWPWPVTPLLAQAIAAWHALFGTMLLSCALRMRRPAEAIIPYATLACWSVLLLALPALYADDVSGAGLWIALLLLLLALSVYALAVALPDRRDM